DFDLIESHLLLPSHHLAAFFRTLDRKGAPTATAHRRSIRSLSHCFSCRPNSRSADLAQANSISLRHRPVIVPSGLNIGAGGDSKVKVNFPGKIFIMSVTVDKSG